MGKRARGWHVIVVALLASGVAGAAGADDYCCICKGKPGKSISAGDDLTAGAQCSITCRRPTIPKPGKCESAPAAAAAAAAPTPPAAASGTVLLFASEDCSGEAIKVTAAAGSVNAGMRSFMLESGAPASVWQKANYDGMRTQPVGAGICISPGWDIGSVRF
jgi:hypothetical protein